VSKWTATKVVAALAMLVVTNVAHADTHPWYDHIDLTGDLRVRNESFNIEGKKDRLRHRIRARLQITANVHDDVVASIGLASGGDDPVSTNQSLDGGFSTKDIRLDLAFFTWKPSSARGVSVTAGKMKLPFYTPGKTQLIWDSDLRPEGVTVGLKSKPSDVTLSLVMGGYWVDESSSFRDAALLAAQADVKFGARTSRSFVRAGGGYFDYARLENHPTVFDASDSFGNSTNVDMTYMYDYNLLEAFVELGTEMGSTPVVVFGDYVTNSDPDSNNVGWLIGARIGKTKRTGSWEVRYNYRKSEMDALLGVFTDSDFIGGGTNGQGHKFSMDVQLAKRIKAGGTAFINESGLTTKTDYNRYQLDVVIKF